MQITCCNRRYSTSNIKTYQNFIHYKIKNPTVSHIDNEKIRSEHAYVLNCDKNNCLVVMIIRKGRNKKLKPIRLKGEKAAKYLKEIQNNSVEEVIPSPTQKVPQYSKRIDYFVYSKPLLRKEIELEDRTVKIFDLERSQMRFCNEKGHNGFSMSPVNIIEDEKQLQISKG